MSVNDCVTFKMAISMRKVKRMERLKKMNKMKKQSRKNHGFLAEQAWKPYEVELSTFADEEMSAFAGMEVLTDYDPKLLKKFTGSAGKTPSPLFPKPTAPAQPTPEKAVKSLDTNSTSKNVTGGKEVKKAPNSKKKPQKSDKSPAKKIPDGKVLQDAQNSKKKTKKQSPRTTLKPDDVKKQPKEPSTIPSDETPQDEQLQSLEKQKTLKRKSGRERLLELKAKRRRRRESEGDVSSEGGGGETAETNEAQDDQPASEQTASNTHAASGVAMARWDTLTIPTLVHQSLMSMGFTRPTPIQAGCIPAAVDDGKDIVGAAETGSGKTLAFGIPLIFRILKHRAAAVTSGSSATNSKTTATGKQEKQPEVQEKNASDCGIDSVENASEVMMDTDEDADDDDGDEESNGKSDSEEEGEGDDGPGCVRVIDNIDDEAWQKAGLPLVSTPAMGRGEDETKLFGLVLTPTRELAVQVKNHLVAAAKMTDIKVAVVVGGMSAEKQKRVLKKRPDIIVGTPGRLWELYQLGEPHLASLPEVQCLIIDEADRMVEKGHYAELSEILDLLNNSQEQSSRQTFVFSATLSLIHLGPLRKTLKNAYKTDKKEKLESVMSKVGIKEDAHVVDLTKKEGTAASLLESKIVCEVEEKDIYLFYFLRQYPGRTLVFTNSIDCIRRLVSILTLLQCNPLPLHSSMHQKQRLKNLERFTGNAKGLLLATDVAARGLDIPDIEHVIHYQVPRTSESYVHRSGRTARQAKVGLSVTLLSPGEINFYRRLCKTLNREELPTFPVEHSYYQAVKERVDLARDIDKLEHVNSKKRHQNDWFVRAAKELDVDLDEHMNLHDMGDSMEQKQFSKKIKRMRAHLKSMLQKKIFASGSSQLYLTSSGKLLSPFSQAGIGAHVAASKLKARVQRDKADDKKESDKKRKRFKRMGRYQKTAQAANKQ